MRPELPTGTVTFIFTDVDGSTSLLKELGKKSYADALADHRCSDTPSMCRQTAVSRLIRRVMLSSSHSRRRPVPWLQRRCPSRINSVRVARIGVQVGVHTGTPFIGEEGYIGHDVHRAARIAAAGHGGQVLVSATTAALVEAELTNLGEHRFGGSSVRPERVFQLAGGAFPELKSLDRTNLPVPATPFLGREGELNEILGLVVREGTRLVMLTRAGGAG